MDDFLAVLLFFGPVAFFIIWYLVDAVGRSRNIWRGK